MSEYKITGMLFKGIDKRQIDEGTLYRNGYETHNRACFAWALVQDDTIIECDIYSTSKYKQGTAIDYGCELMDKLEEQGITEEPGAYDHLDDDDPHWNRPIEIESKVTLQDRLDNIVNIITGKGPSLDHFYLLYPVQKAELARRANNDLDLWVQIIANDIKMLKGLSMITSDEMGQLVDTMRLAIEMQILGTKSIDVV